MSKEEIQELKSEIKRLKNLLRSKDDPNPVSPLAPKGGFLDLPEIDGVEFASAAAAVHYKGPERRHAGEGRAGQRSRRRLHSLRDALSAGAGLPKQDRRTAFERAG